MATVDFTLEDIRQIMREDIRSLIRTETPLVVQPLIEQALIKERIYTKKLIDQSIHDALIKERAFTQKMMVDSFTSFWDHNLSPVLEEMQADIAELKRHNHLAA